MASILPSFQDSELPECLRWRTDDVEATGVRPPLLQYGVLIPDYGRCVAKRVRELGLQLSGAGIGDNVTEEEIAQNPAYFFKAGRALERYVRSQLSWLVPDTVKPFGVARHRCRLFVFYSNSVSDHLRYRRSFASDGREEIALNVLRDTFGLAEDIQARWYFDGDNISMYTPAFQVEE